MNRFKISEKNRSDIPGNILIERAILKEKLDSIKSQAPPLLKKYINHLYRNESARSVNINTALKYSREIMAFLNSLLESSIIEADSPSSIKPSDIDSVSADDIQDYIDSCGSYVHTNEKGERIIYSNSPRTLSLKQTCIKSFFTWLYKNEHIQRNEAEKLRKILTNDTHEVLTLSDEEVRGVLELSKTGSCIIGTNEISLSQKELESFHHTKLRDHAILSMFIYHGLRISELYHMNISSLEIEKGVFNIFRKRNKKKKMYFSRQSVQALLEYLQFERPTSGIKAGDEDALFLSSSRNGREPSRLSVEQMRKMVKKYTVKVSDNPRISPHKLRATFATKSLEITENIYTVQQILDHSSTATTQKYLRDNERAKKEVADIISF